MRIGEAARTVRSMMRRSLALIFALALLTAPQAVGAHSLEEIQGELGKKEKYFQAVDKPAPDFSLVDADGRPVTRDSLRGKVLVLHFIYATCPDVCPLHAEHLARVQELVNQTPMKDQVRFVSITTDPANDRGEILRDYGSARGLDLANWLFLTTVPEQPEDETRTLAKSYGHSFIKTKEGMQIHGIVTHVIDQEGRWRANFHGLKFEPVNLVVYLNALVNDAQRPHGHEGRGFWSKAGEWLGLGRN
jgi:protein SCO1/2